VTFLAGVAVRYLTGDGGIDSARLSFEMAPYMLLATDGFLLLGIVGQLLPA